MPSSRTHASAVGVYLQRHRSSSSSSSSSSDAGGQGSLTLGAPELSTEQAFVLIVDGVAGGPGHSMQPATSVLAYDLDNDSWRVLSWRMPERRKSLQQHAPSVVTLLSRDPPRLLFFNAGVGNVWVGELSSLEHVEWHVAGDSLPYSIMNTL
jgi:hypothetical protein